MHRIVRETKYFKYIWLDLARTDQPKPEKLNLKIECSKQRSLVVSLKQCCQNIFIKYSQKWKIPAPLHELYRRRIDISKTSDWPS